MYGGTAKKTSIKGSIDFDCAVIINGGRSGNHISIPEAVDNFQELLMVADEFDLQEEDFNKTPRNNPKMLQFAIEGSILFYRKLTNHEINAP